MVASRGSTVPTQHASPVLPIRKSPSAPPLSQLPQLLSLLHSSTLLPLKNWRLSIPLQITLPAGLLAHLVMHTLKLIGLLGTVLVGGKSTAAQNIPVRRQGSSNANAMGAILGTTLTARSALRVLTAAVTTTRRSARLRAPLLLAA